MSGAPRSAYTARNLVIIRREAVEGLGDFNTAGVFQRIAWRCEGKDGTWGEWAVSLPALAEEVWLSRR